MGAPSVCQRGAELLDAAAPPRWVGARASLLGLEQARVEAPRAARTVLEPSGCADSSAMWRTRPCPPRALCENWTVVVINRVRWVME